MPACLRAHRGGAKQKVTSTFRPASRRPLFLCEYQGADGRKEADCHGLTLKRTPEVNKVALKYFSALITAKLIS